MRLLRLLGAILPFAGLVITALAWTEQMSRRSIVFAFAINWALMGVAFVLWQFVPIRLGRGYYLVHQFERSGRMYERLGVRAFQRVLRGTGWLDTNPHLRYVPRRGADAMLVAATEPPETAHLLIFLVLCVEAVDMASRGWWDTAAWLTLFNVAFNAYPVLSLRYVRARAQRLFIHQRGLAHADES